MNSIKAGVSAMAAGLLLATAAISPASASTPTLSPLAGAKKYKNCTALNKVYPHGVAKSARVKDHTSGKPVTTFRVNAKVYAANSGLDRDKDGIACEKR